MRRELGNESGELALALALRFSQHEATRWYAWCVARYHIEAFAQLDTATVEALAPAFCDEATPKEYARILSGPAWVAGHVEDERVVDWARSEAAIWRQVAATSTIALNTKGDGGAGDVERTLMVLDLLARDDDVGVRKAVQLAQRALAKN